MEFHIFDSYKFVLRLKTITLSYRIDDLFDKVNHHILNT